MTLKITPTAPVFAEFFHSDWSFMKVPPAGTALLRNQHPASWW